MKLKGGFQIFKFVSTVRGGREFGVKIMYLKSIFLTYYVYKRLILFCVRNAVSRV